MLVLVCKWTTCVMSEFELECQRQRKMIGRIQKKRTMPRRTTKQRGGSTFMKDNVHWQTEKKSYVNPLNCHPSGKFRYSCCLSAAAVGRSSGFLKQEGKCKPIATTRGNNPHGKTFLPEIVGKRWQMHLFWDGWQFIFVELNVREKQTWVTSLRDIARQCTHHTLNMTATISWPIHGLFPAHISSTTHPTLQISILKVYPFFWVLITSGAIQNTVPCMAVKAPPASSSVLFEIPKSDILQIPDVSTRILSALRSWAECELWSLIFSLSHLLDVEYLGRGGTQDRSKSETWTTWSRLRGIVHACAGNYQ